MEHDVPARPHGTSMDITEDGLAYIREKLQQVRDGEGVTMVRFSYDGPGFSWVYCDHPEDGETDTLIADVEPDKAQILRHIEQIKPILQEYEDVIMGVDGGMFGPWGEMHSSTFGTSPEAYKWLIDAWLDAVPAGQYDLYLKINDPKEQSENKRCVRFANNGDIWNAALGANRIGAVKIIEAP